MTSVIQVTQDDIEQGIRADCYYCPVALALERTLGAVDVRVYRGSADWMIPPKNGSPGRGDPNGTAEYCRRRRLCL